MNEEKEPSPAADPRDQSRMVPGRLLVTGAVALVVGVIVLGYVETPGWVGSSGKKFWDYLELLIVPAALAIGVYLLNRAQSERERKAAEEQDRQREATEKAWKNRELEVARQQAQDAALQAYLEQMSQMLADKERPLRRSQPGDTLNLVAEVRTRTVLRRLDGKQKRHVVQFLSDAGLIQSSQRHLAMARLEERLEQAVQLEREGKRDDTAETEEIRADELLDKPLLDKLDKPSHQIVLSLIEADLSGAELSGLELPNVNMFDANLSCANLSDARLPGANLSRAKLMEATLRGTNLGEATLWQADLNKADLSGCNLVGAWLKEADLQHAILRFATLREVDMADAKLQGADLTGVELFPKDLTKADMTGAKGITESEHFLFHASRGHIALTGATMPNGQKYEAWLKDKERRGEYLTNHEKGLLGPAQPQKGPLQGGIGEGQRPL
jgi:uncharacterized protein YjbI with pentapeptide repeats